MKKLRIAVLASNFIRVPPRPKDIPPGYSGAPEKMVSLITEELVKRGHKVTLFASRDSATKAKLVSVTKRSTGTDPKIGFSPLRPYLHHFEYLLVSKCYQMAKGGQFDIIHSHLDIPAAFFAPLIRTPTVTTLHSPLAGTRKIILNHFKKSQYFISISNNQRKSLPNLQYAATIYHGIDCKKIPFNLYPEDYLVIAGRIHPSKGIKEAIQVAKKVNLPLIIMGSHGEDEYWKKEIKPIIDGKKIIYKGLVSQEELFRIIKKSLAFVFPLQWEEPFGLALIESMACGTPVIALDRGSIPEIVQNGRTGFITKNLRGMVEVVKKIAQIPRKECRAWVEQNFTLEKMVNEYEKVFFKILKQ